MQVRCVCFVENEVKTRLCVHHIFLLDFTSIHTRMYYDVDSNVEQAKDNCHVVALQTGNMLLEKYHLELMEDD